MKKIICLMFLLSSSYLTAKELSIPQIFENLKMGNQRFLAGNLKPYDIKAQIKYNSIKQSPDALVLSCMDSRGIPELTFNQSIGHLFTLRVAGNIVNEDILGSIEYATKVVGSKLIVVMGHTGCGAVKGACEKVNIGHIGSLVGKIYESVEEAQEKYPEKKCSDPKFIDEIARLNVLNVIKEIKRKSLIIDEQVKSGQVEIVPAMYDISTGKVDFDIN